VLQVVQVRLGDAETSCRLALSPASFEPRKAKFVSFHDLSFITVLLSNIKRRRVIRRRPYLSAGHTITYSVCWMALRESAFDLMALAGFGALPNGWLVPAVGIEICGPIENR
jgi:hypothetical protein